MPARIVYEDQFVTEYDDGTEEVRFTQAETDFMADHAADFGYACRYHGGGANWLADRQLCITCEVGPDYYEYEHYYEEETS